MNNKYLQDREIIPYKEHYQSIIKMYGPWLEYRLKRNLEIPHSKTLLDYKSLIIGGGKWNVSN